MKHTPGPWNRERYDTGGNPGRYFPITAIRNGKHCRIAESGGDSDLPSEEIKANGTLIAAAPELLQALKNLADAVEDHDNHVDQGLAAHHDSMQAARAAIAKAEGRDA
jgi:hypothetical protein